MAQNHNPESENAQPVLSQDSPKSKTSLLQEQDKDNAVNKVFRFVTNQFFWAVLGIVVSILSLAGHVSIKTAVVSLIFVSVIIVFIKAVKEWHYSRHSHRVFATIFLYTILLGGGVWFLYALVVYSKPVELRFAYLVPADETSPPSICPDIPPDAITIHYGNSSGFTTKNDLRLISVNKKPLVTAKRTNGGLLINLKLFDSEGNELATIIENKFVGKVADNLDIKSSDHSIDIFDKNNSHHIFHIRYLNRKAIEIFGVFNYPGKKFPLEIYENGGKVGGQGFSELCVEEGLGIGF